MDLQGKTVIVTGGGRGIGRASALELARQGAHLVVTARTEAQLAETCRQIGELGAEALAITADVRDRRQVEAMVFRTIEHFGQVDVLINNAASFEAVGPVWAVDVDQWWGDLATNLLGPFLCCRAVLPGMIQRDTGVIINMFGGGGGRALPGASGYGGSKAALMRLTDTLAAELQDIHSQVQVFGFDPGFVPTAMTEQLITSPAGQRWMPLLKDLLATGQMHTAEVAAQSLAALLRHVRGELSGRIFAYHHNFAEIARQAQEIKLADTYQLRYL